MNVTSPDIPESASEDFDIFRQVVAFSTSNSWKHVPHVAYLYEPDVTEFLAVYRETCRAVTVPSGGTRTINFTTVLLKLVAEALAAAPRLNAFLRYNAFGVRGRLSVQRHVNITLPWLMPDGKVVTVVVPHVEEKPLVELQSAVDQLAVRIAGSDMREVLGRTSVRDTVARLLSGEREGITRVMSLALGLTRFTLLRGDARRQYYARGPSERLTERDIDAGTVVVSNIGSLQKGVTGKFGLLDVVAPQVFAVGISAVEERPGIVRDADGRKTVGIRSFLPFCLVFDHRAFELGELLPFVRRLDELFAGPRELVRLTGGTMS